MGSGSGKAKEIKSFLEKTGRHGSRQARARNCGLLGGPEFSPKHLGPVNAAGRKREWPVLFFHLLLLGWREVGARSGQVERIRFQSETREKFLWNEMQCIVL